MSDVRTVGLGFMAALWAGDTDRADALLAPDAIWQFQPGMPQAEGAPGRTWPARAAMRRIIADLFGKFDPTGFAVEVTHTVCEGNALVIEYEARGKTVDGRDYHNYYVTVLMIIGDLVAEIRPYNDTRYMLAMLNASAAAA